MLTARDLRLPILILALCGSAATPALAWFQPAAPATPAPASKNPGEFKPTPRQPNQRVTRNNVPDPIDPMDMHRFGAKSALARVPGEVRIATYNLENLFDDKDDPKLTGKNEDKGLTKPKAQCEALAKAIHDVNPDILAVEEIESKEALVWFRDNWLKDMGYQYVSSIDAGDDRGIEQGVLSRFPITKEQNWPKADLGANGAEGTPLAGQALTFHRSPLRVDIQIPAVAPGAQPYDLTLYVVHQKSGKDWGWFREIESKKILSLVQEQVKENYKSNIIVLGDFNATAGDDSFKTYLTGGGLLDLFKGRDAGKDPKFITHASGRAIDHILVSRTMNEEFDQDTRFVLGTAILPEGADFSLAKDLPGYASDHFPVSFDLKPIDVLENAPAAPATNAPAASPAPAKKN